MIPNSENKLITLEQPKSDLEPWIVPKTNFAQKPTDSVFEKYGIALTPEANPDLPPLAPEPK